MLCWHRLLIACLVMALAGCVSQPDSNVGANVPAAVAAMKVNSLVFSSQEFQLGDEGTATLVVSNEGKASGTAVLQLASANYNLGQTTVTLAPGATQTVSVPFVTWAAGTFPVQALLSGQPKIVASLTVRAPNISGVQTTYEDLTCTDRVPFHINFQNTGDGTARNVIVQATIYNTNNVAQDTQERAIGNVGGGATAKVSFELFAPDTCGRDDYYRVAYTITPQFGQKYTETTTPFSI